LVAPDLAVSLRCAVSNMSKKTGPGRQARIGPCQRAKQLETELAKGRNRRLQVEEESAVDRETPWVALEDAKQAELREELQSQAIEPQTVRRVIERGNGACARLD